MMFNENEMNEDSDENYPYSLSCNKNTSWHSHSKRYFVKVKKVKVHTLLTNFETRDVKQLNLISLDTTEKLKLRLE